jgi:hypothetical protein
MVSKSKILGKPSIILISIGTTEFPFHRVTSKLKNLNKDKYKIISDILLPDKLVSSIKTTDKIIIHGGPATIYLAVKYARFIPLIIPRLVKYGEHVDNHQLYFVKYLRNKLPDNLKKYFVIDEKVDGLINDYLKEKGVNNNLDKFLFLNKNELTKNLNLYLNKK